MLLQFVKMATPHRPLNPNASRLKGLDCNKLTLSALEMEDVVRVEQEEFSVREGFPGHWTTYQVGGTIS